MATASPLLGFCCGRLHDELGLDGDEKILLYRGGFSPFRGMFAGFLSSIYPPAGGLMLLPVSCRNSAALSKASRLILQASALVS